MREKFKQLLIIMVILLLINTYSYSQTSKNLTKEVCGYFVYWGPDNNSFKSLQENQDVLTQISIGIYRLMPDGVTLGYQEYISDSVINEVLKMAREYNIKTFAMLQNYNPDIQNSINPEIQGDFDSKALQTLVSSAQNRTEHIKQIMAEVRKWDYDGIEVDYEQMALDVNTGEQYKDDFTAFVRELADSLHAIGKEIAIAVHPKFKDEATWGGPAAQDYAVLYEIVDHFRIMTYDFSWSISAPGAIAPYRFVKDVLSYTVLTGTYPNHREEFNITHDGQEYSCLGLGGDKVYMGVAFYGYDWYKWDPGLYVGDPDHDPWWGDGVCKAYPYDASKNTGRSDARTWEEIQEILNTYNITPVYELPARELHKYYWGDYGNMLNSDPTYGYAAGGIDYIGKVGYFVYPCDTGTVHYDWKSSQYYNPKYPDPFEEFANQKVRKVYFEDHITIAQKLALVDTFNIRGISIWRLGGEDPENWNTIWNYFGVGERQQQVKNNKIEKNISINIYPNPFNPVSNIDIKGIDINKNLKVSVYDINGKMISQLYNGIIKSKNIRFSWNGEKFSSGVYFVKVINGNNIITKKMILMK